MSRFANKAGWALAAVLGLLLILAAAQVARGGSLDPPGLPGSTMKTLDEVEPRTPISSLPYVILEPGSYYVTKDLTGVSGQHGITINAHNVTLDLGGFTLTGVPGSLDGIHANFPYNNIAIVNGFVRLWSGDGIDLIDAGPSRLSDCASSSNSGFGVDAGPGKVISSCVATGNSQSGFRITAGSVLQDCTSSGNAGVGIVVAGSPVASAIVGRCTVRDNTQHGISVIGANVRVADCAVSGSGLLGISVGAAGVGTTIVGCSINTTGQQGIAVGGEASLVSGNTIVDVPAPYAAIDVTAPYVTVKGNHIATSNIGIQVLDPQVVVEDNTISEMSNEGISVTGVTLSCTIEGNTVTGSATGILISGAAGCSVVRNVAKANTTNYSIVAGNDVGPVTTGAAQASPAGNVSN